MSEDKLIGVVAHECGHIACRHMLYHTLAQIIANASGMFETLAKLAVPIHYALMYWQCKSELSCDRAVPISLVQRQQLRCWRVWLAVWSQLPPNSTLKNLPSKPTFMMLSARMVCGTKHCRHMPWWIRTIRSLLFVSERCWNGERSKIIRTWLRIIPFVLIVTRR